MLIVLFPEANAAVTSSDYFWVTDVVGQAVGNGKVTFEFDINATHTMKELGASQIMIYEQQSGGTYKNVKTYTRNDTSGLIQTNTAASYGRVAYPGVSGRKYYAMFALYAKDSDNTSETIYKSADFVVA